MLTKNIQSTTENHLKNMSIEFLEISKPMLEHTYQDTLANLDKNISYYMGHKVLT